MEKCHAGSCTSTLVLASTLVWARAHLHVDERQQLLHEALDDDARHCLLLQHHQPSTQQQHQVRPGPQRRRCTQAQGRGLRVRLQQRSVPAATFGSGT